MPPSNWTLPILLTGWQYVCKGWGQKNQNVNFFQRGGGLVLYSYEGPGKHVTLSLRACVKKTYFFQLHWLMELNEGHISQDCRKSVQLSFF